MNLISQDDDDIFSLRRIMLVSESFPKTVAAVGKNKKIGFTKWKIDGLVFANSPEWRKANAMEVATLHDCLPPTKVALPSKVRTSVLSFSAMILC